MNKPTVACSLFLGLALTLLAGCGGSSFSPNPVPVQPPAPLSSSNLNLIFVASEDLAYQASGDINPKTANLTNQGLQRSLQMATFLQQNVLGKQNVTEIYALEPMTHLQTEHNYPDMVGLETIQQFALLNQVTLSSDPYGGSPYAGQSYPINASYADATLPVGVVPPSQFCPNCQGLDFHDQNGDNESLLTGILKANVPGFYVFSAPWETVSALMINFNQRLGYPLTLPSSYISPNVIYAIAITPSGSASLATYNSNLNPPSTYPVLSPPLASAECNAQTHFNITVIGGQGGAVIPAGINTNETLYIIRHADAHPRLYWDDNNYVGAGQWRALDLPNALLGKVVNVRAGVFERSRAIWPRLGQRLGRVHLVIGCAPADRRAVRHRQQLALQSGHQLRPQRSAGRPEDQCFLLQRRPIHQSDCAAGVVLPIHTTDDRGAAHEL